MWRRPTTRSSSASTPVPHRRRCPPHHPRSLHRGRREHRGGTVRRGRQPFRRFARACVARAGETRDGERLAIRVRSIPQRVPRASAPRRGGRAASHRRHSRSAADDPGRRCAGCRQARRTGMGREAGQPPRPQGRVRRCHAPGRTTAEDHRPNRRLACAQAPLEQARSPTAPCSRAHLAHRHRRRPSAQGGRAQSRARPPPAHRLTRTPSAHGSPMPDFRMQKPSPHRKKDEQDARTFFLPPLAVKYWR